MSLFHTITDTGALAASKTVIGASWASIGALMSGSAVKKGVETNDPTWLTLSDVGIYAGIAVGFITICSHIYTMYVNRQRLKMDMEKHEKEMKDAA